MVEQVMPESLHGACAFKHRHRCSWHAIDAKSLDCSDAIRRRLTMEERDA